MKTTFVTALLFFEAFSCSVFAQGLPETDIWLTPIDNGLPATPTKISDGDGYNNQPHFSADGAVIWYTREMPGDGGAQTDIAAFNVATSSGAMVTYTVESEYSPTPIPGRLISLVRSVMPRATVTIDLATYG